ncbi:ATP-binding cassette domain-containing protein [Novosphingobium sp. 9]|uniref:ATP-binding cassette domain-containing protein n=1 Tax=Novosphingobium sp. 9 TaxID=2025349 RepID=UPI0021B6B920|nr:ATP-binding cassette domain-containing protein [Novosphingobium sp. 9]
MAFDIALTIRRGNRVLDYRIEAASGLTALFGASGAGKTSLLDAVAGLVRPTSGHISVAGTRLFDAERRIDLPPEQRRCGYVFQDLRLFPHKSVRDNLLFGFHRRPADERWMTLDEACAFLGIAHLLDRRPRTLSGGEAQRVAIGRALLSAPRFLLFDEPLASVDAERREDVMRVIERLRDDLKLPILYVSHDRAEVERLADRIVAV